MRIKTGMYCNFLFQDFGGATELLYAACAEIGVVEVGGIPRRIDKVYEELKQEKVGIWGEAILRKKIELISLNRIQLIYTIQSKIGENRDK